MQLFEEFSAAETDSSAKEGGSACFMIHHIARELGAAVVEQMTSGAAVRWRRGGSKERGALGL